MREQPAEELPQKIREELRERVPLFQPQWLAMLRRMREHRHAPRWNALCGDRLQEADLPVIRAFEESLAVRTGQPPAEAPAELIRWLSERRQHSWWFEDKLRGINPEQAFTSIPFMERYDLQARLEQIVPHTAELSRLIINPTSGTSGQPILCPSHPAAIGCYDPMIRFMLARHGVPLAVDYRSVAAIQLCMQQHTITYNTVHSLLAGAGFAKINLAPGQWPAPESAGYYIAELAPVFLSGDPFAFYMAMQQQLSYRPRALLSTALGLSPLLRRELKRYFGCPVINLYSLNETGPVAYSCPLEPESLHLLPTDIYVETIDAAGCLSAAGGELVITGGRNPYLPLLRYRTGDYGVLDYTPCGCGDPLPRIRQLSARQTVFFRTPAGGIINPVDLARILKDYPVVTFQFHQAADYACTLRLLPAYDFGSALAAELSRRLRELFRDQVELELAFDLLPGADKVLPFVCELTNQESLDDYFQY